MHISVSILVVNGQHFGMNPLETDTTLLCILFSWLTMYSGYINYWHRHIYYNH